MQKLLTFLSLENKIEELRQNSKVIVTTNGCFDILHAGHVRYLRNAKTFGDILIVCLNSDSSVKKLKGETRPINSESDRAEILSALEFVDYVIIFDEQTPSNVLEKIKPDIHVKGGDYTEETLPEAGIIKKFGGKVIFSPLVEGRSTTKIINKFNSGRE